MRQLATSRTATGALLALTAALMLCAVEYTFHLSSGLTDVLNNWVYNNVMLAAGAACVARGILRERDRVAWILMGAAVCAWGIGDTIGTFAVANDPTPPFPSSADIGFLAVYPPAYAAIVLLLRSRTGTLRGSLWLDGVIGGLAVAALGTAVVFEAVLGTIGGSPAAVATNLAYPLADLTLIALVVWALAVTGWKPGRTWGLIAAGLLVFSISDCLYLYETATSSYVYGSPTDLGWIAGGLLLAWAAWQPQSRSSAARVDGWPLLAAPAVFGLAALGVFLYDHEHRINPLSLALASAAILAVIARMALTFAENMKMIAESRGPALNDPACDLVLVLYDLNGFKLYNDSFGHLAGDSLLARLGANLSQFVSGRGEAYRMGGDEFCIVVGNDDRETGLVIAGAARALGEQGQGFTITAAFGSVLLPDETRIPEEALRLADQRMYMHKQGGRLSAGDQSSNVLLRALAERHPMLGHHVTGLAELERHAGTQFDPVVVAAFAEVLADRGAPRVALAS